MDWTLGDTVYQVLLGLTVIACWVTIARRPDARTAMLALVLLPVVGFALAAILSSGFGVLRLLTCGVFIHTPIFFLGAACLALRHRKILSAVCLAIAISVAAIGYQAFFVEPFAIETTHYRIESARIAEPLRIVVLADIQTDHFGEYERSVFQQAIDLAPDLFLFPGDYVQMRRHHPYRALMKEMRELLAPVGELAPIYAVRGDIDEPELWPQIFDGIPGHTFLESGSVLFRDDVRIVGLDLDESRHLQRKLSREDDRFQIVVGHAPDFALDDVESDLMVAGHTHGGQVQLPGFGPPITLSHVPRAWAAGARVDLGPKGVLVVSRGVGLERGRAPRLRFLCRPQIVVIEVVPIGP